MCEARLDDRTLRQLKLKVRTACESDSTKYQYPLLCSAVQSGTSRQSIRKRQAGSAFSGVEHLRRLLLRGLLGKLCEAGLSCSPEDVTLPPSHRNDYRDDLLRHGVTPVNRLDMFPRQ
uniref:Uncharacterized protein LOC100373377 n=1 Tax=Saccoglossus kowalevskii TaxID=10224 RepID=A0ABM0MJG4_SACKO|nr:PREDICTED: uncharacterized protein LOC100373377 [Saccoglossus kowalevskii]